MTRAPRPVDEQTQEAGMARRHRAVFGVLVPVVTALAGLMFAVSITASRDAGDLRPGRDLRGLISERDDSVARKVVQVDGLQAQVEALSKAAAPADSAVQQADKAAERLIGSAGMTEVSGDAVVVTLTDSSTPLANLPDTFGPDDVVVHQQDVQAVVNALWANGAEAMMLQDQRVVSTSAVRCVGNTLILQGRVYAPPYTIRAIGDIERLRAGVLADPTVQIYQQYVTAVGLGWDLSTEDDVTFPAFSGSTSFDHAVPIS